METPSVSKENDSKSEKEEKQDEGENIDISTPCWFYMDGTGLKQGPFSFKEMFLWWKSGYFHSELLVKSVWDDDFQQLGHIPEFYQCPQKLAEKIEREQEEMMKRGHIEVPQAPTAYYEAPREDGPNKDSTSVTGGFNAVTGKFQSADHFAQKGLPSDRDMRMMSHYFDLNDYQKQMQDAKANKKKKKLMKGTKKFWKDRKEKKRRLKLVAEYLAD